MPDVADPTAGIVLDNPDNAYGLPFSQSPNLNSSSHAFDPPISGGGSTLTGTWDEMQAITPTMGQRFYTEDQGVDYVGIGGDWFRTTGYRKDIWVTDYGWKCDNQPGSAPGNVIAYNLAYAAARDASVPSVALGHRDIYIPEAHGFTTAYVDDELNFRGVHVKGIGGTQDGQRVRVSHVGAAQGTKAIFYCGADGIPGWALNGGKISNIYGTAYNCGVRTTNTANIHLTDCWFVTSNTGLARNHSLMFINTFWLYLTRVAADGHDGTTDYAVGFYADANDGPIGGIQQTFLRDCVMTYGAFYVENAQDGAGQGFSIQFQNVLTELSLTPFLTARSTGAGTCGMSGCSFIDCGQPDYIGPAPGPFFDFDGDNKMNFINFTIRGGAAAEYLIKSVNHIALGGWDIDTMGPNQLLFDPTSSTTNVYGMMHGDKFGHGLAIRANIATSVNASEWGIGITDSGLRVGKAIGETHARGMWRSNDGALSFGSGSAIHDVYLDRSAAGTLRIDSDGAGGAATLAVGTLGATSIAGTTITGTTVIGSGSLRVGGTPAGSGGLRLPNDVTITARNAANSGDVDMLKLSATDVTTLTGSSMTILTTANNPINFAPNSTTSVQVIPTGLNMIATTLLATAASVAANSGLRVPHGTAPSAPTNGDIWTTTAGLFVRVNGATVGPLS